jgi:hypothetical protein
MSPTRAKPDFVETPMVTIDKFLDDNNLKPEDIDYLRMDIEGYEVVAFQGMLNLLKAKNPLKILMEIHSEYMKEWNWNLEKFVDFLGSYNLFIKAISYEKGADEFSINNPTRGQILDTYYKHKIGGFQAYIERV